MKAIIPIFLLIIMPPRCSGTTYSSKPGVYEIIRVAENEEFSLHEQVSFNNRTNSISWQGIGITFEEV